jgi:hypothetical protein
MMFYQAAGGEGFAGLANDYQSYCDLSRQLELGGAILVADVPATGSRLIGHTSGENEIGDVASDRAVVYRFLLPVQEAMQE